ncbi:transposase domain-containing protein [Methylosinus sp. Sm6]|uniref:transposase domain-containing protein n=1 Tax=Methylosinus sp. Sm6 TaxID=2866948 RepID=UPI001C9951FF|nr:transposase domain-containing protein [Methylosinus sp. Sm6]MBY6243515.1 Mu transposase C-terminal domain-containing protein [Methylosinus sp. Sm6]
MAGDWLTTTEILALGAPSLPSHMSKLAELISSQGWRKNASFARVRFGRGGGYEYHLSLLPPDARAKALAARATAAVEKANTVSQGLWAAFDRLPEKTKEKARRRLVAVEAVQSMGNDCTREVAVAWVAKEFDVCASTLWSWLALVEGVDRGDRLPHLAPRHVGRTATAECDPRAWDFLVADYLRAESPAFEPCYRRLTRAAAAESWSPIPSSKTLQRRIEKEIPRAARTLARSGREAAQRIYPHQRRTKAHFHAVQSVNADGHKFDVFVKWADGSISRPMMVGFQDLYSGMVLAHRIDKSENKEMVRLAFADVVERFGIPEKCWLDNGRAFASKWLTGRLANRYRFKIKDEDPEGILLSIGCRDVHWTTPYHGQAKPIERAWKDMCANISTHPAFAGAYTGNKPDAKPENYGKTAVPEQRFREIVASEIAAHNTRPGRRTATAKGRSFQQTLQESLDNGALVRRATKEQRRMLLMAAEGVNVDKRTGEIALMESRYWAEELVEHIGKKVIVRFDPQNLGTALAVYTLDNRFIAEAQPIGDVRFDDVDKAREHARVRNDYVRKQRDFLEANRRLDIDQVAALLPQPEATPPEPAKVTRLVANGPTRGSDWDGSDDFARGVALMEEGAVLPFRKRDDEAE